MARKNRKMRFDCVWPSNKIFQIDNNRKHCLDRVAVNVTESVQNAIMVNYCILKKVVLMREWYIEGCYPTPHVITRMGRKKLPKNRVL